MSIIVDFVVSSDVEAVVSITTEKVVKEFKYQRHQLNGTKSHCLYILDRHLH